MSELGRILKEQRERLNLSLSEASLSTKIGARMIASIEEGDYKSLPALPFAKGFVRSYANYLKLDADQMVTLYLSEIGELHEPEPSFHEIEKNEPAPTVDINDESGGLTRFFIIGGVIVLIVAIVGVKGLVDKYKKEADISHQTEVSVSPIEKEVPPVETPPTGASPTEASPTQPPETLAAPESGTPESTASSAPIVAPVPTEEPTPQPAAPQPTEASPAPTVAETPAPTPALAPAVETPAPASETPAPVTAEKKQVEILLEALDRVQISLSVGGETKKISLSAGEVHILRTGEKVVMDISDAGALNLVVNGQSRGVPGSLGQRKKVQLP